MSEKFGFNPRGKPDWRCAVCWTWIWAWSEAGTGQRTRFVNSPDRLWHRLFPSYSHSTGCRCTEKALLTWTWISPWSQRLLRWESGHLLNWCCDPQRKESLTGRESSRGDCCADWAQEHWKWSKFCASVQVHCAALASRWSQYAHTCCSGQIHRTRRRNLELCSCYAAVDLRSGQASILISPRFHSRCQKGAQLLTALAFWCFCLLRVECSGLREQPKQTLWLWLFATTKAHWFGHCLL